MSRQSGYPSKRAKRMGEAEAREERQVVDAARADLIKLEMLARHVRNEAHLDAMLADHPDPVMKVAIKKLVMTMLQPKLVDGENPLATTAQIPVLIHE